MCGFRNYIRHFEGLLQPTLLSNVSQIMGLDVINFYRVKCYNFQLNHPQIRGDPLAKEVIRAMDEVISGKSRDSVLRVADESFRMKQAVQLMNTNF